MFKNYKILNSFSVFYVFQSLNVRLKLSFSRGTVIRFQIRCQNHSEASCLRSRPGRTVPPMDFPRSFSSSWYTLFLPHLHQAVLTVRQSPPGNRRKRPPHFSDRRLMTGNHIIAWRSLEALFLLPGNGTLCPQKFPQYIPLQFR